MLSLSREGGYRRFCFLPPRLLCGQRGLKLLGGHSGFRSLLPSHFGSAGAIHLDEVLLAGPTREREQADAFGTTLPSRLRARLRSTRLRRFRDLSFLGNNWLSLPWYVLLASRHGSPPQSNLRNWVGCPASALATGIGPTCVLG